jgi:hypothetical protein
MSKHHAIYESRPQNVTITLGGQLYMVPKVALNIATSLIS